MTPTRTLFFVSDGTGITAETLGQGLLSQFEGVTFHQLHFPFLDTPAKVHDCLAHIHAAKVQDGVRPLVMMTLMDSQISVVLRQADAFFLDLFETFIAPLELELGQRAAHVVGRTHGQAGHEAANRIAAIHFALAHDDGISDVDLAKAEVILIGVSRSGKTPTSLYLSLQFSVKVANYPLIPEDFERDCLPHDLSAHTKKLFGLTISPDYLHLIRQERKPNSHYASLENCRYEVAAAERMMRRAQIPWIDTTARSIEEVAVKLMQIIR
jgi:regulator of PEP synthase PpsR (kinase-PPPase family)